MRRWTSENAAKATGGQAHGAWEARGVSIDSRSVKPGELFVAIAGERFDGHDYVKQALGQGAAAAMVNHIPPGLENAPLLKVNDTLAALADLGRAARAGSRAKIVGVTGSVGKTSTKAMLAMALSARGKTFASAGNFNNHIGTPLNLANLDEDAEYAVFEMGMNHAGEIAHLTRLVRPHVAVITNVEAVHQEFFPSVEAIADAKSEIFEGLSENGIAVLNRDDAHFARCAAKAPGRIITFGAHEQADMRVLDYRIRQLASHLLLQAENGRVDVTMKAVGKHWAATAACVLAAVQALGGDVARAARALAAFSEVPGRGALSELSLPGGSAALIDDSYNASPASMRAAIAKLADIHAARGAQGRTLAALGDMLELGAQGPSLHAALAADLASHRISHVFTAGPLMKHLADTLPAAMRGIHAESAAALLPPLRAALQPGDTLLVKGSHGSHMHELAAALAQPKEARHAV